METEQQILTAHEQFHLTVHEIKGENAYYIEGHISTTDADNYNDIITDRGQDELVSQLNALPITMDIEHDSFIEDKEIVDRPKNLIPVAKVVEVKRTFKGTHVKAQLNTSHPQFKSILDSIKNGYLHSFSVAYVPVKPVMKSIGGVMHRLLDSLRLLNVGITGIPVNPNATFAIVTKSYNHQKMVEDKTEKLEAQVTELTNEIKSATESHKAEVEKLQNEIKSKDEELAAKVEELNEVKSQIEATKVEKDNSVKELSESFNEIKSELATLKESIKNTGVQKTHVKSEGVANQTASDLSDVISYI